MATVESGELVVRVLADQGVRYLFCVNGGHIFPILAHLKEHGIQLIHMRHEQATAYAADGWARASGTTGVCCVTAGCGLTNAVTGLAVAGLTGSSVVCLSGNTRRPRTTSVRSRRPTAATSARRSRSGPNVFSTIGR